MHRLRFIDQAYTDRQELLLYGCMVFVAAILVLVWRVAYRRDVRPSILAGGPGALLGILLIEEDRLRVLLLNLGIDFDRIILAHSVWLWAMPFLFTAALTLFTERDGQRGPSAGFAMAFWTVAVIAGAGLHSVTFWESRF